MNTLNICGKMFAIISEDGDYDYCRIATRWTRESYKLKIRKIGSNCYEIKIKYYWSKDC